MLDFRPARSRSFQEHYQAPLCKIVEFDSGEHSHCTCTKPREQLVSFRNVLDSAQALKIGPDAPAWKNITHIDLEGDDPKLRRHQVSEGLF